MIALSPARSRTVGTVAWDTVRRAPGTTSLLAVVLTGTAILRWGTTDPEAVERWASTNLVNLYHHPAVALIASAFLSADAIRYQLIAFVLACAVLERRIGTPRMLAVIAAGHVIASLVTEGGVQLAILMRADSLDAAWQLDVGISYAMYTAIGAALLFVPPRFRLVAVLAVALDVIVPLVTSWDMTSSGHVLSLAIGLLTWPLLRAWLDQLASRARFDAKARSQRELISSRSVVQDGGTAEATVGEVGERVGCPRHRIGDGRGADAEPPGQSEELLAVASGVGGDATQPPLLEQLVGVVQRRNVRQPDPGDRQRAPTVQRAQGNRDQLTGGREQDRAVERLRR
jgi:hypothetical protein